MKFPATPAGEQRAKLHSEVVQAAVDEFARVGGVNFQAAAVAARFADRGVHRATLFRWVAAAVASGHLGQAVGRQIAQSAERRAAAGQDPAEAAAELIAERMPEVTTLDDIGSARGAGVLDHLNECIRVAHAVMRHATNLDGTPKMSKLMLGASEHLRRCTETSVRVLEKIHEVQRVEQFHRLILEEVRKEAPDCHRRILERMDTVAGQWGAL